MKKITKFIITLVFSFLFVLSPALVFASGSSSGSSSSSSSGNGQLPVLPTTPSSNCVQTSLFGGQVCSNSSKDNGILRLVGLGVLILTYGIGIAATIGFVFSGYQYITAGDNQSQVAKAKMRIFQIVIGLIVYAVLWSLLNFFIPGLNS